MYYNKKSSSLCTLWGKTFDSNEVASIDWHYLEDGVIIVAVSDYVGNELSYCWVEILEDKHLEKAQILSKFKEAIKVISSKVQ